MAVGEHRTDRGVKVGHLMYGGVAGRLPASRPTLRRAGRRHTERARVGEVIAGDLRARSPTRRVEQITGLPFAAELAIA
jgi:hypothetical protein